MISAATGQLRSPDPYQRDAVTYQLVPQPSHAWKQRMGLKSGGRQDGSVAGNASRMAAEYGYNSGDILSGSGCLRILVSPEKTKVDYVLCDGDESDATVAFSDGVPPGLGDASNDAMRETTP